MKFDNVPGVVIDHIPASTKCYVGSPSIVILPDGAYLASHDIFGPGSLYNTSRVFRSDDRGVTWRRIAEIEGAFWSNLFIHRGDVYLMGTSGRFGSLVIRRSTDGGSTWSTPEDGATGLLRDDGEYHTAPMPIVEHKGRLWRAFEDIHPGTTRKRDFRAFVMSVPVDADLLDAASWSYSNPVAGDASWLDGEFGHWLEGNAVLDPDGLIVDILRVDYRQHETEKAAIVRIGGNGDGKTATFAPDDFIDFPGGCKKFSIRKDPSSVYYWTLSNYVPERFLSYNTERARNTLALMRSKNLRSWEITMIALQHEDLEAHAFQYVDWQFEGGDLVVVSRTAYDDGLGGAHNQHDANFMTFHRIEGFRERRDPEPQR
jgi:hypothetical protein